MKISLINKLIIFGIFISIGVLGQTKSTPVVVSEKCLESINVEENTNYLLKLSSDIKDILKDDLKLKNDVKVMLKLMHKVICYSKVYNSSFDIYEDIISFHNSQSFKSAFQKLSEEEKSQMQVAFKFYDIKLENK